MIFLFIPAAAENLVISPEDLHIEESTDGGYHLWVNAGNAGSILITESTRDPEGEADSYSLRNPSYNPVNGDEKRMLNGEFLDPEKKLYSLIDSTATEHPQYGSVFHIFIPYVVVYGYPWSRSGEIQVLDGTYLNIRAFAEKYGDYSGGFRDNPFIMRVIQRPAPIVIEEPPVEEEIIPAENYMPSAKDAFKEIAEEGNGEIVYSLGEEDVIKNIAGLLDDIEGETLDLVLALDTTMSMKNDIPYLQEFLLPFLEEKTSRFANFRFGMVLYKDYMELYLTKIIPFQTDLRSAARFLNGIRVHGGRDIPEAVHEALYAGIHSFAWQADSRLLVLIGDAPPHPRPVGRITAEIVYSDAEALDIEINTIILPQ